MEQSGWNPDKYHADQTRLEQFLQSEPELSEPSMPFPLHVGRFLSKLPTVIRDNVKTTYQNRDRPRGWFSGGGDEGSGWDGGGDGAG